MPFAEHVNPAHLKTLAGWCAVISGLALYSWLHILADRRAARLTAVPAKEPKRLGRCPHRDWDLMTGIVRTGLAQTHTASTLHARAAERIDAAEYAFNRLLAECAAIMSLPNALAPRPVPVLARRPARYAGTSLAA
jgi:hypothetical protein